MGFNHASYFAQLCDFDHRKQIKSSNRLLAVWQDAKSELGNNQRMDGNSVLLQLLVECGVPFAKVIDPY